jgi:hypothetical protein
LSGGATEPTQLANNAELIAQVAESVKTVANTLMTAQATMQQLRQLSPGDIALMTGLPVDQVAKMAEAYQVMSQAGKVYQDAAEVLRKARSDAVKLGVSPAELLRMKAYAAAAYGGVYKQTFDQEQAKLERLADVSRDVQRQAEAVKGIDANVKGIQFLASQNVKMQGLLVQLNDSIAQANANAAEAARRQQIEQAAGAEAAAAAAEAYAKAHKEAEGSLKLPTEIKLTK